MELSPVIAPLSQAFIKCERGWLLYAFYTWNTDNFLPRRSFSRPPPRAAHQAHCRPDRSLFEGHLTNSGGALAWHPRAARLTQPVTKDDQGKRTVATTSTRQKSAQWTISSLLKAWAIKSISSPVPFSWLQYEKKKQNKTQQRASAKKNHGALLPIGFFFFFKRGIFIPLFYFRTEGGCFHFSKTIPCSYTWGETKTNILSQWSSRQETILFIMSGTAVTPLFLSKQFTCASEKKKKKEQWLAASLDSPHGFMLFAICARGETLPQPSSAGPLKEARQGGDQKVRYRLWAEVEINASLSHSTNLLRLWVPGTSVSPVR